MVSPDLFVETAVNGLLLGGIYALAALGLTLVFGIMDIVNLAHGHMLMLGGYVAVILFATFGISPLVGMFAAIALLFALGVVLQRVLINEVVDEGIEQPILVLFGVALVFQNLGSRLLGGDARSTDAGLGNAGVPLGWVTVSLPRVVTFLVAVALVAATWAFLRYTWTGQAVRATAQNRAAARYVGVDTDRVYVVTMGIGAALAGAAGALLSMLFPFDPFVGWSFLLKAFAVVVLGGIGSVVGTLVGGLLLGVSENLLTLLLGGGFRDLVTFGIFVVVLLVMPEGLFGNAGGDG